MKIRSMAWGASLFCVGLLLAGCTTNLGDFTVLSSKNVNLANFSNSKAEVSGEKVQGEDCVHIICLFPTGELNLKTAVDRALESKNAFMLTNARVSYVYWYVPLIYGQMKFVVEGNPTLKN
jgi:hypothetical protein